MNWLEIKMVVDDREAVDGISNMLTEIGTGGVMIEDPQLIANYANSGQWDAHEFSEELLNLIANSDPSKELGEKVTSEYKVLKEEDAENQGLLDGITWDEYKAMNQERTKLEVDEDLVDLVAKASGISSENISFVAYEEPMYIDAESLPVTGTDILQIVLIVLILGLLAFVIFRSMRSEKVTVEEEEVSVESLLQSIPESTLEEIEAETKSETRKLIEKFVDENPEAAANLLRNWLNEDWE